MKQQKKKEAEYLVLKEIDTWVLDDYLLFLGLSETSQKKHGATAGKVKANVIEHFRHFLEQSNDPLRKQVAVHFGIDSSTFINTVNLLLDVVKMQHTSLPYVPPISIGSVGEINSQVKLIHDTVKIFFCPPVINHENSNNNLQPSNTIKQNTVSAEKKSPNNKFNFPPEKRGILRPTLVPLPLDLEEETAIQKEETDSSASE